MRIKKGDSVKILYGKDAGSVGKVVRVLKSEGMVVVEGKNVYKKHIKGDGQTKKSEIITIVKPMHISKVQLINPEDNKPTRVGYIVTNGKKVRISKRTGKEIDVVKEKTKKKETSKKTESKEKDTKAKKENKSTKTTKKS